MGVDFFLKLLHLLLVFNSVDIFDEFSLRLVQSCLALFISHSHPSALNVWDFECGDFDDELSEQISSKRLSANLFGTRVVQYLFDKLVELRLEFLFELFDRGPTQSQQVRVLVARSAHY
jgi:hypothetical protein